MELKHGVATGKTFELPRAVWMELQKGRAKAQSEENTEIEFDLRWEDPMMAPFPERSRSVMSPR